MKNTEEIRTSKSNNKTAEYVELAKFYMNDSQDTADTTGQHIVVKIAEEIRNYAKKAMSADCEYAAYVNCNAAEVWYLKIEEQF